MTVLVIIIIYLALLLALGLYTNRLSRGTSKDYFVASHSIGPFLLLMSVFGTTMTAFALVGSTGKTFERGIGVYGLMASISGLVHAAVFFLIGIRLWAHGKRHGFVTQIQFFRARFDSDGLGYLLFPILVLLVIPYLLIGIIGAGKTIVPVTKGAFPEAFAATAGGVPPWLTGLVICLVVLTYVFAGGSRGAAWANTFQTLVFMVMGVVAFFFIARSLGGLANASNVSAQIVGDKVVQNYEFKPGEGGLKKLDQPKVIGVVKSVGGVEGAAGAPPTPFLSRTVVEVEYKRKVGVDEATGKPVLEPFLREHGVPPWMFFTYLFIPLSVGMFPHLFQHWLTARSAKTFRLTVVAHPLCILVVWLPCVLIGSWATGLLPPGINPAAVLAATLKTLVANEILTGLLVAGILAAIMSSLDSQFLCLGTMFTNDIVLHRVGRGRYTDKQIILIARAFVVGIVAVTYALSLAFINKNVFDLAVWCFSGFGALFPLVFAAVYWRRATAAGAVASVIATTLTWFVFFAMANFGGEYVIWGGVMPVAVCFAVSALTLVGVSLCTRPPSDATIEKFFPASRGG